MEEYKKKYEEAILRMNKWVEGSEIVDPKEVAEFVFPELKESEDEKIREWLIRLINTAGYRELDTDKMPCSRASVVAWLEKQGEQIDIVNKEYWRGYREGKQEVLDKYTELEKQGEQKPADKIEPKFNVGDIIRHKDSLSEYVIESISGGYYHGKGWGLSIDCDEDYELVEQKHVWSEEDENYCLDVNAAVSDYFDEGYAEELKDWLKSLKERYT